MIELLIDFIQQVSWRFWLGLIVVVPTLCALAPLFINLDDYTDPRS